MNTEGEPLIDPTDAPSAVSTSPGPLGWIFTFLMAVAALLLIADMVRRIRRVRYRDEIQQEISEEQATLDEAREKAAQKDNRIT